MASIDVIIVDITLSQHKSLPSSFSSGIHYRYNFRMDSSQLSFGIFALVGVVMLVLSATSFGYLLRIKNKSKSSWMLLWFFLGVILSSIATILTNTGTDWAWAFAPSQDAFLILGGVFLVRFAYIYPTADQPAEARVVLSVYTLLAVVSLSYAFIFAIRFLSKIPAQIEENQAYYLLTPLVIVLGIIVFLKRSQHLSGQPTDATVKEISAVKGIISSLIHPNNQPATALRNYGFALSLGLIPAVTTVSQTALPAVVASYLFNFGVVVAIGAIMLVYLNHAPEPTTISAKLTGISLVTVLLILGLTSVWFILNSPGVQVHDTVLIFIYLVLISSLLIIFIFPFFFRSTLLDPLEGLLSGVKIANQGDLDIQVEVRYEDEIGFLTHSFNRMVRSLKSAAQSLKDQSVNLEKDYTERTVELRESNEQLRREILERKNAEIRLDQQLQYEKALAGCSQALLVTAEDKTSQQQVLTQALEHLRAGTQASRAYLFRNFEDLELGLCMGILAEACAPEIHPHLDNPANQRFPWSHLPTEMKHALEYGEAHGGPVEKVFASTPDLRLAFLSQPEPLLSMQCFPITIRDRWWGFVGFDDCETVREWDQWEVALLDTASEMISNTLQRWDAEAQLKETLEDLENRIKERTGILRETNKMLIEEIQNRRRTQMNLEGRLQIERQLAVISARLQQPSNIRENVLASLQDLGNIMHARRVVLLESDLQEGQQVREFFEWHNVDQKPTTKDVILDLIESLRGLRDQLLDGETIFLESIEQLPTNTEAGKNILRERGVQSLLLSPLIIDRRLHGILGCSNLNVSSQTVQSNLRAFELVANMFSSLLQREYLIHTLEEQVAERTHQLTTFMDMAMVSELAPDLGDVLQPTLHSITDIASCDACGIHIFSEGDSSLQLTAQRGIPSEFVKVLSNIKMDPDFTDWLEDADPYQVLVGAESRPVFPEPFCLPGYQTFFATRLSAGGESLGLLSCYRIDDKPFSAFQATVLTALGELLGIIVENHRLRIEAEELAALEERQRLAREVHDAVSQSVYSLSLFARSASDALNDRDETKLISNLQDIEGTSLQVMREMRLLLYQLREPGGDDDIPSALEARFRQVENRLGIQATYEIGANISLPTQIQHEVWRIITEALNNTVKHANASQVHIQITNVGEQLVVTIQDDGIGFDDSQESTGMGLNNMRARADNLGGRLGVSSTPGGGTQVMLQLPLNDRSME